MTVGGPAGADLAVTLSNAGGPSVLIATLVAVAATVPAGLRWLRVSQREHYLSDACGRFALRWWTSEAGNIALAAVALAGLALSSRWPLAALAPAGAAALGPLHLSVRGRTSKLVFTRRLRTLGAAWAVLQLLVVAAGVLLGAPAPLAAAGALLVPALVDTAAALVAPVERRLGAKFVTAAAERLVRVGPTVVGVTGSYGKTSTKSHIAHLVSGTRTVVASPASFNNRAGLARAVNEQLAEGTEVFVAEMGTYGPGEIADLCRWCPPRIAVITAIGPVHLERFGTEERIVAAKAEITRPAAVVVLNVDDPRLAALAAEIAAASPDKEVVGCSEADTGADVCVRRTGGTAEVWVGGAPVGSAAVGPAVQPTNLACAVAVALRLGVPAEAVVSRVADLPVVANRLAEATAASGVVVIDDTFNSNPAGARAALAALAASGVERRRVVVTPGMVELGSRQREENLAFGRAAVDVATDFVVVGRTNRRALTTGAAPLNPVWVRTRDDAVAWVRTHLGIGDAVLYENDLPDQYP